MRLLTFCPVQLVAAVFIVQATLQLLHEEHAYSWFRCPCTFGPASSLLALAGMLHYLASRSRSAQMRWIFMVFVGCSTPCNLPPWLPAAPLQGMDGLIVLLLSCPCSSPVFFLAGEPWRISST